MNLTIIIPYLKTNSGVALTCRQVFKWLKNNGFKVKSSKEDLCLTNIKLFKSLGHPNWNMWMRSRVRGLIGWRDTEGLRLFFDSGLDPNIKVDGSITGLMWAGNSGHTEGVKLFLDNGADIEMKEGTGMTALIVVVVQGGHLDCLRLLLDRGANIDAQDKAGSTALMWAVRTNKQNFISLLLERGADPHIKDILGIAPASYIGELDP